MKTIAKKQIKTFKQQRGMTVIELLVAGVISLIAAFGMILVMANTLGTGSKTIQMAKVTQEMRTAMQIMSRELRRANYHASYMSCFRDVDCLATLGIAAKVAEIGITDIGSVGNESDCFWFWYDRPQPASETQILVTGEPVSAFRRTVASGVGRLQMTTTRTATPGCNLSADWVDITDPELIDVLTFNVDDAGSFVETINVAGDTQSVERIGLTITARLTPDASLPAWLQGNVNASRELREFVTVRNHTYN